MIHKDVALCIYGKRTESDMKRTKLAVAVMVLGMSQATLADDTQTIESESSSGTYWGVGIGSVLGAVIAGPPGAAIGAALGGGAGWTHDLDSELTLSEAEREQQLIELEQARIERDKSQTQLYQAQSTVAELKRSNALQAARLADLFAEDKSYEIEPPRLLKGLTENYAQEVYFKNGESDVPDYAMERLSRLSMFLKDHPKLSVTLTGYTDQVGPAEANLSLAQQRVDGVREQLIAGGVDASRIQLNALGESTPTVKAGDVANYVLDRRVSIVLGLERPTEMPVASLSSGLFKEKSDRLFDGKAASLLESAEDRSQ
jgi:outer membrane protein OmpA-like peptidoglycan-associated protein